MKYMITWNERPQGTPIEYENAQKRILEVFSPWKAPANFKIESFVIRVGDWSGYMLMECDDPLEVHKFCSMLPAFTFGARPVVPVADAIRVERRLSVTQARPLLVQKDSSCTPFRMCATFRSAVVGSCSQ